jgi:hypothetical protein
VSLANVQKHWRFLLAVFVIFLAVAAAAPLLFYGLPALMGLLADRFGNGAVLVMAVVFIVAVLGWLFFVLWVGDWVDRRTMGSNAEGEEGRADG